MTYRYTIDHENRIAYLDTESPITKDEVVQVFRELTSNPAWEKDFNILNDFTRVEKLDLSFDDISFIIEEQACLEKQELFTSKLAIVAPTDSVYGTGRMWQMLSGSNKFVIGVFRTKEEAAAWLEEEQEQP